MKKYFFLLLVLILSFGTMAQTPRLDSISRLIPLQSGEELLNLYIAAGKEYIYVAPLKSVECGEKALSLAEELNVHSKDAEANLIIGAGYLFSGNFEKGKDYTDRGLKIARESKNVEQECAGLNSLGVYYMNTGDYQRAIDFFQQTFEKALSANLTDRVAMVKFNIGAIYTNQGKLSEGLKAFQEALKYFNEIGDKKYIARTLMNIAVNYHSWSNYDKALEHYLEADDYFKKVNDNMGRVASLNNIGEIYKDQGNYQEAIKYYQQSLDMAISLQSKVNEAVALIGLGEAFLKLRKLEDSKITTGQALDIFVQMEMTEGISRSKRVLSEIEYLSGNLKEALMLANESEDLARKAGIPDILLQVTALKSRIMAQNGNYRQAYSFLRNHHDLKDSLFNDNQRKRLEVMQTEIDLKLKENEIILLQKENQIKELQIKRQQTQTRFLLFGVLTLLILLGLILRLSRARRKANILLDERNRQISEQHEEVLKANETKNRFLAIIGHDLRSPVGAFAEMLGQIVDHPEIFEGGFKDKILGELRKEADSTYYLLDNLLSWAKTQKENIEYNPENINLRTVIAHNVILNSRFSENKGIKLVVEGNCNCDVYFDHNMLNLIMRNLISNALKFSYSGGTVTIKILDEDEKVRVCVVDQGVGIDEANIPWLFDPERNVTTYGTANEKGSGLGLILCHEFVKNDGGEINVTSKKGEGTTICFTLRKAKKIG